MWYDHPNWWQWLILIGIAIVFVLVWLGCAGFDTGKRTKSPTGDRDFPLDP